jgi:hypothetical protein
MMRMSSVFVGASRTVHPTGGVPLGPSDQFCKLFGTGIIRTDLNGCVERRHARRDAIVESQNPAVIAVAFNGDLEHCQIHAEACCAHGNHGRAA